MRAPRTWRHYHHPTFDFWITTLGLPTTSLPVSSQVLCHQASGWNWKGPAARALQAVEGSHHQLLAGWLRRTTQRWRAWRGSKVGGCKAACSKAAGLIHVPGYCNPQHRCGWRGLPACSVRRPQHGPAPAAAPSISSLSFKYCYCSSQEAHQI